MNAGDAPPARAARADWLTVPNAFSLGRLVLLSIAVALWLSGWQRTALCVGFAAGIADYLDGYLARRLGQVTPLGAVLDQLSDQVFESCVMVGAVVAGGFPAWVVFPYLVREFAVLSLRNLAQQRGVALPSVIWGKVKTNCLAYSFLLLFVGLADATPPRLSAFCIALANVGVVGGLCFSYLSAGIYLRTFLRSLR